jgi:hypothetical protein
MVDMSGASKGKLNVSEQTTISALQVHAQHSAKLEVSQLGLRYLLLENESLKTIAVEVEVRMPVDVVPVKIELAAKVIRDYLSQELSIDDVEVPFVFDEVLKVSVDLVSLVDHSLKLGRLCTPKGDVRADPRQNGIHQPRTCLRWKSDRNNFDMAE